MEMKLSDRLARRIGRATRWGRLTAVAALALLLALVVALGITLAWRPGLRLQNDWTATGELTLQAATRERLARIEEPVEITGFFSRRPTRRLELLRKLCLLRDEPQAYARREIAVRLEAIERVQAWIDRLAFVAGSKLRVRLLDREREPLAYENAIEELALPSDGRMLRMLGGYDPRQAYRGRPAPGLIRDLHPGLTHFVAKDLPRERAVLAEVEYVDLVVVRCGRRREILFLEPDLVEIEHCHLWSLGPERPPRLAALRVAAAVTAAIERVQPQGAIHAAWIGGHDARPLGEYRVLLRELARAGVVVLAQPLALGEEEIPTQLDLLISIDPRSPFGERESAALHAFIARGGGLIAVAGARRGGGTSPWNAVLERYGMRFLPGRICRAERPGDLGSKRCATVRIDTFNPACEISYPYASRGWSLEVRDAVALEQLPDRSRARGVVYRLLQPPVPAAGAGNAPAAVLARRPWIDTGAWNLRPDAGERRGAFHLGLALDLAGGGRVLALGSAALFEDAGMLSDPRFVLGAVTWAGDRPVAGEGAALRPDQRHFEVAGALGATWPSPLAGVERGWLWRLLCRYAFPGLAILWGGALWWLRRRA